MTGIPMQWREVLPHGERGVEIRLPADSAAVPLRWMGTRTKQREMSFRPSSGSHSWSMPVSAISPGGFVMKMRPHQSRYTGDASMMYVRLTILSAGNRFGFVHEYLWLIKFCNVVEYGLLLELT